MIQLDISYIKKRPKWTITCTKIPITDQHKNEEFSKLSTTTSQVHYCSNTEIKRTLLLRRTVNTNEGIKHFSGYAPLPYPKHALDVQSWPATLLRHYSSQRKRFEIWCARHPQHFLIQYLTNFLLMWLGHVGTIKWGIKTRILKHKRVAD